MTHATPAKALPSTLQKRLEALAIEEPSGLKVIDSFGMLLDTHRDQPHVGTFNDDIHRGQCIPTLVDYLVGDDQFRVHRDPNVVVRGSDPWLLRHEKHMFITQDEWAGFLVAYMMQYGADPRDGTGSLPTSHFRDARAKVYLIKSFRQMIEYNEAKATP